MTASVHRMPANRLTKIGVVAGVLVVSALIALLAVFGGGGSDSPQSTSLAGHGAGGDPPPRLLEVHNSLPFPSGITTDEPPVSTGVELQASYWATDQPEEILGFYDRELVALGWEPAELPTPQVINQQPDPTHPASTDHAFVKDDLVLIIGVAANTKAPQYGASRFGIHIEPR
jgi:hypothetical protein